MVFSCHDWANSGWKMCQAMNRYSTKYELHYFALHPHPFNYYRGENVLMDSDQFFNNTAVRAFAAMNKECAMIHFKGDEGVFREVSDVTVNLDKPIVWTVCGIQWRSHHAEIWGINKQYISKLLCTTPDLIYDTTAEVLPFALDEKRYHVIDKATDCTIIGHSISTNRKGSDMIMRVIDELTQERSNVFMNIQQDCPYAMTMELKRLNHIFIDQIFDYNIYGNSAVEGMAFGSAVVAQTAGDLYGLVNATPETLKQVLINLIDDSVLLKQKQTEAYDRFIGYHSYKAVAARLERIYDEVLAQ